MRDDDGAWARRCGVELTSTSALAVLHTISRILCVGMARLSPEICTITGHRRRPMRACMFCTIFTLVSSAAIAQQPAAQSPPPPKLFAGAGDVTAMIAKAKAERKPGQANYAQPIVRLAPYTANLEYRVAGVSAPASV